MHNVTVSLTDELVRWARVWAAEHDTSISAMLSQTLKEKMEKEKHYLSSINDFFIIGSERIERRFNIPIPGKPL